MFKVVLGAVIGGLLTAGVAIAIGLAVEGRRTWFSLVIFASTPGAIVGAIAGATSAIVAALSPREGVSWDEPEANASGSRPLA